MNNLKKYFQIPKWLFVVLLFVLLFRIPTLFEPYSYGDETIYLALGEGARQGLTFYKDIHDNKPPLLYYTAAIAGSLFWFKAILLFWMIGTTVLFWRLTIALFPKKENLQKVATIIFAILTTIPLFEGHIANAELFMLAPTIGAFLLLLSKEHTFRNVFLAGTLFSVATMFKVPAAFDIPAIVFLWFATMRFSRKNVLDFIKKSALLALGFAVPLGLTFLWYWAKGAFSEYLIAAYLQNFGYLSSWRPEAVKEPFLVKNGPLLLRAGVVATGLSILFLIRNKVSKQFLFICAWMLLSLFAITLSERPYPHYLVQAVPAISLLLGMLFTLASLEQSLVIIPLSLFFFVPVYFKFWYYPTLPYYTRFISYVTGTISHDTYLQSFGGETKRNYKVAQFLQSSTKEDEYVFVWGSNSSTVYALARRLPPMKYVADYHIFDFSTDKEVMGWIRQQPPELVVLLPDHKPFPELLIYLQERYGYVDTIEDAEIWKHIGGK